MHIYDGLDLRSVISPAQITASQDDYNPTGLAQASVLRLNTDAGRNITGIAAQVGRVILIVNTSTSTDINLVHDATSTAGNRFLCPGGVTFKIRPYQCVFIWYDNSSTRWRVVENPYPSFTIGGVFLDPAAARDVMVWRAPYPCTVLNVRGHRKGGSAASVNARKNQTSDHLSSNLSLSTADAWADGGAVQNASYSAGDDLEIRLVSVTGPPTEVAIQVDLMRTGW